MFCAYCGTDDDESAFTPEHIVPYAIGGADQFTIPACGESNNRLGGLVDKPFVEMFVVRSKRFFLGLRGTDGTEPTLDFSGTTTLNGEEAKVRYRIDADRTKHLMIEPSVTRVPIADGERWSVRGDPVRGREILRGIFSKAKAEGKKMKTAEGKVLEIDGIDALLATCGVEHVNPSILKTINFDLTVSTRFFAKLALATGHYVLGENFSRSERANFLRGIMYAQNSEAMELPGAHIWPRTEASKPFLTLFAKPNVHVLGVLDTGPTFIANLFGDIDAIIPLKDCSPEHMPKVSYHGTVFEIELPSRKFKRLSLDEYVLTLVTERRIQFPAARAV
jgi:hypothetical protein